MMFVKRLLNILDQKKYLLSMLFCLIFLPSIHEFGHLTVAYFDGAQVNHWSIFPQIKEGHFIGGYVNVNEYSFSSLFILQYFKLAGFFITFFPSLLLTLYLRGKEAATWLIPYGWTIASPAIAGYDFYDFGRVMENLYLGKLLFNFSYVFTAILLGYLLTQIIQKKV